MKPQIVNEIHVENETVKSLREMAIAHIEKIEKLKAKRKNNREMIESLLTNIAVYRDAKKVSDSKTHALKVEKMKVMATPEGRQLEEKRDAIKEELKEAESALSDYLGELNRMTGETEIEDNSGKKWSIVKKYKICAGQMKMF